MLFCHDCLADGKQSSVLFDLKFQGYVCPRCERIFQPGAPLHHFAYTTEAACKRRMERDQKERRAQSVSTRGLVERILRPID